ncbi:MAG: YfgG family protein [Acinetobacter sp.]
MSQVTSLRQRHRFNSRMIRIVLLISFIFFFGRFVYSAIGAWQHHQDKKESQQSTLPQQTLPAQIDKN